MDKIIRNSLTLLNLSPKEIAFFEACFSLGSTTITQAAKKARLERSTAYLIATELIEQKLIVEDFSNYRKIIRTITPKQLLVKISARQRILQRQEIILQDHLAELEALHKITETKPTIQYFQGISGLHAIWRDILSTKNEILLWTNQEKESRFFTGEFHNQFIKERITKGIPIRALVVNNKPGKAVQEKDEKSLRNSKLLPLQTSFNAETYLYENKIATLDYKKDIFGIIIESEAIASTQRAIFEMAWNSL